MYLGITKLLNQYRVVLYYWRSVTYTSHVFWSVLYDLSS